VIFVFVDLAVIKACKIIKRTTERKKNLCIRIMAWSGIETHNVGGDRH
jgi:hypothetical protein